MESNKIKRIFKFKKITSGKGFTLMELLVATMIFVVGVVLFSQIYISVLRTEKIAYGFLNNISSLEYAIDFITREIRMGKDFQVQGDNTLVFNNRNNENITYYLSNNQIYRRVDNKTPYPITPLGLTIKELAFKKEGGLPFQRITLTLTFSLPFKEGVVAESTLKTTVTPRLVYTILNR
ncbi:MAG: prepilin-type N-terminal cleavage/methylation domain-containing protein [Candidatus Paceibacterota bacterium]